MNYEYVAIDEEDYDALMIELNRYGSLGWRLFSCTWMDSESGGYWFAIMERDGIAKEEMEKGSDNEN